MNKKYQTISPNIIKIISKYSCNILHVNKSKWFLDWTYLSKNTNIPITFFEKHIDKVNWLNLSRNTNIPYTFFEKNKLIHIIDWNYLCLNINIPYTFFEKHLDKVNWFCLSRNSNISY